MTGSLVSFARGTIIRAEAHRGNFCPLCGSGDWPCWWREDGHKVGCAYVQSNGRDRSGQCYVHTYAAGSEVVSCGPSSPPPPLSKHATPAHKNTVYSALLGRLRELPDLSARGITSEMVERFGYRRTPDFETSVFLARQLAKKDLAGVPGFFRPSKDVGWRMVMVKPGFFIPVRNSLGQIHGLQYRLDEPEGKQKYKWLSSNPEHYTAGTSSGTPFHFARPDLLASSSSCWLTEGAHKANVAADILGEPFIAAAGVSMWRGFAEQFRKAYPHITEARVAFDVDWSRNPDVRRGLHRLRGELLDAGFKVAVKAWSSQFKGIDDYLLSLSHSEAKGVAA
jgi:hypothetical protein